ncbi:MAG: hypothetical protein ABJB66_06780 [Gemmatimonadaceae bacterium]
MNAVAEILHILRKDLVRARWLLMGFALLVSFSAWRSAVSRPWMPIEPCVRDCSTRVTTLDGILAVVVFAVALMVAASLVQSDSTQRFNSFWKLQPVRTTSVFGAKLASLLLTVVSVILLAQFAAAWAMGIYPSDAAHIILAYARFFVVCVACASVCAAITSNLRGFLLSAVAILVGTALFWIVWGAVRGDNAAPVPPTGTIFAASIATSVLLLFWLFRIRTPRGVARIAAMALTFTVIVGATYSDMISYSVNEFAQWGGPEVKRGKPADLSISAHRDGRALTVVLTSPAPAANHRLLLVDAVAQIVTPSGRAMPLSFTVNVPGKNNSPHVTKETFVVDSAVAPLLRAGTPAVITSGSPQPNFPSRREVVAFDNYVDAVSSNGVKTRTAILKLIAAVEMPDSVLQLLSTRGARITVSAFIEDQSLETLFTLPASPATHHLKWGTTVSIAKFAKPAIKGIELEAVTGESTRNPIFAGVADQVHEYEVTSYDSTYMFIPTVSDVQYSLTRNFSADTLHLMKWQLGIGAPAMVLPSALFTGTVVKLVPFGKVSDDEFSDWLKNGQLVLNIWEYSSHSLAHAESGVVQQNRT